MCCRPDRWLAHVCCWVRVQPLGGSPLSAVTNDAAYKLRQVQDHIGDLVTGHFGGDAETVLRNPILFGDFRTALREGEARVYEDIQDYEAAQALFQVPPAAGSECGPVPRPVLRAWETCRFVTPRPLGSPP